MESSKGYSALRRYIDGSEKQKIMCSNGFLVLGSHRQEQFSACIFGNDTSLADMLATCIRDDERVLHILRMAIRRGIALKREKEGENGKDD